MERSAQIHFPINNNALTAQAWAVRRLFSDAEKRLNGNNCSIVVGAKHASLAPKQRLMPDSLNYHRRYHRSVYGTQSDGSPDRVVWTFTEPWAILSLSSAPVCLLSIWPIAASSGRARASSPVAIVPNELLSASNESATAQRRGWRNRDVSGARTAHGRRTSGAACGINDVEETSSDAAKHAAQGLTKPAANSEQIRGRLNRSAVSWELKQLGQDGRDEALDTMQKPHGRQNMSLLMFLTY